MENTPRAFDQLEGESEGLTPSGSWDRILRAFRRWVHVWRHDETSANLTFAALWRRAAAWSTDVLLFVGAFVGVVVVAGMRGPFALAWRSLWAGPVSLWSALLHQPQRAGIVVSVSVLLGGFAAWVIYRVVCTGCWGRTVGKCFFGIQVVRAEDPSNPPGLRRAAIRWLLPPLAGALPLPGSGMLLYVVAVRSRKRQGGHDLAARTVVIRRPQPVIS